MLDYLIQQNLLDKALTMSSIIRKKGRNIYRKLRFSRSVDDLTTEFTSAFKKELSQLLEKPNYDDINDLEPDWTEFAEDLDDIHVVFQSEEEAIVSIADSIVSGSASNDQLKPSDRETLEVAVAEAYRQSISRFADRLSGTDLADVFETETTIKQSASIDEIDNRLGAITERLQRFNTESLRNIGIKKLDSFYFERNQPKKPKEAWLTRFTFADVESGYPLERQKPANSRTASRRPVHQEIIDRLNDGENLVVLGEGGSGKSTVCKRVACRWSQNSNRGPVFYRPSFATGVLNKPGNLEAAIESATDDVLIVIEDSTTADVRGIYDVASTYKSTSGVQFLFESRNENWSDYENLAGASNFKRIRRQFGEVSLPEIDERECQRAISHYEQVTGDSVELSPAELHAKVEQAGIGESLLLAYEISDPTPELEDDSGVTALEDDVHLAYESVQDIADGNKLSEVVALMINLLNAAELPTHAALLHSVGTDPEEHRTIEQTRESLSGTMFQQNKEILITPHKIWSELYIEIVLAENSTKLIQDYFKECINAIFQLCINENRRDVIREWSKNDPELVENISNNYDVLVNDLTRKLATIGQNNANFADLYGRSETWEFQFPDSCSPMTKAIWYRSQGERYLLKGEIESARSEFRQLQKITEETDFDQSEEKQRLKAIALNGFGTIALRLSEFESASEHYQDSLAIMQDINDVEGKAECLKNLALTTYHRGDYEQTEYYCTKALMFLEKINNTEIKSRVLLTLASVSISRNNFETAKNFIENSLTFSRKIGFTRGVAMSKSLFGRIKMREEKNDKAEAYYKQSLTLFNRIGDKSGRAKCLRNLSEIAIENFNLDAAEEYTEESLLIQEEQDDKQGQALCLVQRGSLEARKGNLATAKKDIKTAIELQRKVDDKHGVAQSLTYLANIEKNGGENKEARISYNKSLYLYRSVGDDHGRAYCYNHLGSIAKQLGELNKAEAYYNKSIDIYQEIGLRAKEADVLTSLGSLYKYMGDYEKAEKYYEKSKNINEEFGDRSSLAYNLNNMGTVSRRRSDFESSEEYHKKSIKIMREIGDRYGEALNLYNLGRVDRMRGELDSAEKYLEDALEIRREFDIPSGIASCKLNLGLVAKERGNLETAERKYKDCLEIYGDIGDAKGRAHTLGNLGNIASERGDLDEAESYIKESLEIKRDIEDRDGEATSLLNLGVIAKRRNNLDAAVQYYEQSLRISRELGERHRVGQIINNLGCIADKRNNLSEAQTRFEESLEIREEIGDTIGLAESASNLGTVADRRGMTGLAIDYFSKSLKLYKQADDYDDIYNIIDDLISVYARSSRFSEAVDTCEEGISIAREIDDYDKVEKYMLEKKLLP